MRYYPVGTSCCQRIPGMIAHGCMVGHAAEPRSGARCRSAKNRGGTSQLPARSAWHSTVEYGTMVTSSIVFDPLFPTTFTE
jgi:hypothetical protein